MIRHIVRTVLVLLLTACSGTPVHLGDSGTRPPPTGASREITASACGFQLLAVIPIGTNDRQAKAYAELVEHANGDYITDVKVTERWTYAYVGTVYCTDLTARAIRKES